MSNKRKKDKETPLWIRVICGFLGALMILGVLFMVVPVSGQSIAYAGETDVQVQTALPTDVMIDVGLYSGAEAVTSFTVQSDQPVVLSYRKSDSISEELLVSPTGELTAAIDANLFRYGTDLVTENLGISVTGGYHIQISYFTFSELGIDDRDNPVYIEPGVSIANTNGYTRDSVSDSIQLLSSVEEIKAMNQPIFPYFTDSNTYIRLGSYYSAEEAQTALTELEKRLTVDAKVVSPSAYDITVLDSNTSMPVCEVSTAQYDLTLAPETGTPFTDSAGRIFRGSLILERTNESSGALLQVVNRLPLEEYVAALLSCELSAEEDPELLKAMAIILRTEATRHMNAHAMDGFDVCGDSHCHLFSGSTADSTAIRKAVIETAGMILTYWDMPIYTPYTVQSGSTTISSEEAFGKSVAYLPTLVTPWEDTQTRWTVERSPYELYQMLSQAGYEEIKGNIQSVTVTQRAENSDYVTELVLTDIFENSVTISSNEQIRMLFAGLLPSTNFVVGEAGKQVAITRRTLKGDTLEYSQSQETVKLEGTYGNFVFSGNGEGCGVGFSISGGRALALKGYTYDVILAIYYPETKITN